MDPALLPLWRRLHSLRLRKWLPPTQDALMSMSEFVDRMHTGCALPNCVYPAGSQEYYYLQSQLAQGMLQDIDLHSAPLSCLGRPGVAGKLPLTPNAPACSTDAVWGLVKQYLVSWHMIPLQMHVTRVPAATL